MLGAKDNFEELVLRGMLCSAKISENKNKIDKIGKIEKIE
jgi:hypothetical protein